MGTVVPVHKQISNVLDLSCDRQIILTLKCPDDFFEVTFTWVTQVMQPFADACRFQGILHF
jgi:hypothetical protein